MFASRIHQILPDFHCMSHRNKLEVEEVQSESRIKRTHNVQGSGSGPHLRLRGNASPQCTPTDFDILCGRGRGSFLHQGNRKYLHILRSNIPPYLSAAKRSQKGDVVRSILSSLKSQGYRFIKQEETTQTWHELDESEAYLRTAHALRDIIRKQKSKKKKPPRMGSGSETSVTASKKSCSPPPVMQSHRSQTPTVAPEAPKDDPAATLQDFVDDKHHKLLSTATKFQNDDLGDKDKTLFSTAAKIQNSALGAEGSCAETVEDSQGKRYSERNHAKPMDPLMSPPRSIEHGNQEKDSPSFDIFFELNSGEVSQILMEIENEKIDRDQPDAGA
eukprot:scaffold8747_cov96-Cylindrotheca_fusiformis.AAC.4